MSPGHTTYILSISRSAIEAAFGSLRIANTVLATANGSTCAASIPISGRGNTKYLVPRVKWEKTRYAFNKSTGEIEAKLDGEFTQYPLQLAYAVTVHKSQGKTYEAAHINLGSGAFAHGLTYVALSRCRSLKDITIEKPIRSSDIMPVNPHIKRFESCIGIT